MIVCSPMIDVLVLSAEIIILKSIWSYGWMTLSDLDVKQHLNVLNLFEQKKKVNRLDTSTIDSIFGYMQYISPFGHTYHNS